MTKKMISDARSGLRHIFSTGSPLNNPVLSLSLLKRYLPYLERGLHRRVGLSILPKGLAAHALRSAMPAIWYKVIALFHGRSMSRR